MKLKSINPYNQQLLWEFEEFSSTLLNEKIELSAQSFSNWRTGTMAYRSELMFRLSRLLEQNVEELAKTITLEMGKPLKEAKAEVLKCQWLCRYYAENAAAFLEAENIETDAKHSFVMYEPLGVILGIMPWNFPFWQVFRFLVPTLISGNVAVLKHASNVQNCAAAIERLFHEAGFPQGVMTNLVISSAKVKDIIRHRAVKAVSLTGSVAAGMAVAAEAGRQLKKSVLELGGSNSFIVLDDADIDRAVEVAVTARMMNCGQSCIAAKRFFIDQKIAEEFTKKFVVAVEKLKAGNPMEEDIQLGPLNSISQAVEVEKQVEDSIAKGAVLLTGGIRKHAFYSPTVLSGVAPGMPCFDEEVFGPVASITVVSDQEEAVRLANASEFGLGTTLFTSNLERAKQLVPMFEDGAVFINSLVKSDPRLPFGGTKKSGYGRELSWHGLFEFVNVKTVFIAGD